MHKHPGEFDKQFAVQQHSGSDGPADDGGKRSEQERVTAAVADFVEHRSVIEQTKGMLMLIYGLDEAAAFKLLQWLSQEANVKLRILSQQIAAEFRGLGRHKPQSAYNEVLLTAHHRVKVEHGQSSDVTDTQP